MKKQFRAACITVMLLLLTSAQSFATNGHQLSAIGAYQQGMGGAVTAAPYDASTAITNPAGMAMIGSRTDFSFEMFFPDRKTSFAGGGTTSGNSNPYLVPAIGWTAPTTDRGDWFFGGGMYGVSGMGVDYDVVSAPFMATMLGWDPGSSKAHLWSQYQFWKMAPTLAWKGDTFSMGFALNLDYQAFGFKNVFTGTTGGGVNQVKFGMDLSEMQSAMGVGATVGFIYTPSPSFSIGASYASKQIFNDFRWRLAAGDVDMSQMLGPGIGVSQDGVYKMKLDFPQQAAVGIAIRPTRTVLWTVDVKWINYSSTYDVVKLRGNFTGGVTELPLNFGWDDVWVYATGLQFDVTPSFVLRIGYNHSNSPIKEEDVENNLAFPAIVTDRASGGFTYRFGRNWEMTVAYMKAFPKELTGASMTTISLEEQAADFELSYRF